MRNIILPTDQVMQLTRVRSAKKELQLRFMGPEGLAPGADNRWTNDHKEVFVSLSGRDGKKKDHRIAVVCGVGHHEKVEGLGIMAHIKFEDGWVEIASISTGERVGYVAPPPEARGRGLFGVVLAETVALALENDVRIVSVIPDNKKLRYYYAGYDFVGSQKGALFLPIDNFSLEPSYS
ncbi:MAG: hypothetical protein ABH842_03305 [Candidatus Micrarchaeota archaeon]